jgi:hypothetical protein
MICVAARKELNRCIRNSDSLREITPIFKRTLQLFLDSGYIQSAESTPGEDWSGTVCQSLAWMNEMNDSAFLQCFDPLSEVLVRLIAASSNDLRRQIGISLQRRMKLVGSRKAIDIAG